MQLLEFSYEGWKKLNATIKGGGINDGHNYYSQLVEIFGDNMRRFDGEQICGGCTLAVEMIGSVKCVNDTCNKKFHHKCQQRMKEDVHSMCRKCNKEIPDEEDNYLPEKNIVLNE